MEKISKFVPPILKEAYRFYLSNYGWFGDYKSWEEAKKKTEGYDSEKILEKVKKSTMQVKMGKLVYERDSALFDKITYSPAILAGLMLAKNNGVIDVVDFGGSLGSTYFQNKKFLDEIKEVNWSIIEQKNFVECGKKNFQDKRLKFYYDFDEISKKNPNLLILSSVLQYLDNPYKLLKDFLSEDFEFVVIDRTPFFEGRERITIQKVNPKNYEATYPCRFFEEKNFFKLFEKKYRLIEEFDGEIDKPNIKKTKFKGFLFKRR